MPFYKIWLIFPVTNCLRLESDGMREKFLQYILDNFTIDNDGRIIISNIIDWFWMESFDKEDTVNALLLLLDGIGIEKEEIEQFIDWN